MSGSVIQSLITKGKWYNPVDKAHIPIPVSAIVIEEGIIVSIKEHVEALALGSSFLVVSDSLTHEVMGKQVESALASLGIVKSLVFSQGIEANIGNALAIVKEASRVDVVVAVGSGTINDLCKYASFLVYRPYIVFGTAPSMNGYVSANASITVEKYKKSLACHLPKAVFLDLDIWANAPKRLIRSGLGDSLCRSTAQADWLLSHILWKTPYLEEPFTWLEAHEKALFDGAEALLAGDREMLRLLGETLILSGLGMVVCKGSYPASQGEHMIAHVMEMAGGKAHSYHGEQIGVTTLTMSALQHVVLEAKPIISQIRFPLREVSSLLGKELALECRKEVFPKKVRGKQLEIMNAYIAWHWDSIRENIAKVMVPEKQLRQVLEAAQAPVRPEEIGWDYSQYMQAVRYASYTRNRFTFLDLSENMLHLPSAVR